VLRVDNVGGGIDNKRVSVARGLSEVRGDVSGSEVERVDV